VVKVEEIAGAFALRLREATPVPAPEGRGEYAESASCGRAIFGDFGTTIPVTKSLRPEIAKGGSLG